MSVPNLTSACLGEIMCGVEIVKPVLQILGTKRIQSNESSERFRLLISDGIYLNSFAMLATQLNEYVTEGKLVENTIVRIDRYITSMVNKTDPGHTKRVLIILGLEVLKSGADVGEKIGNPVQFTEGMTKPESTSTKSTASAPSAAGGSSFGSSSTNNNFRTNPPANQNNSSVTNYATPQVGDQITHPISSLSPYQNKWVIKARVTSKSSIRTWNNAKGEGKLFSMDLIDESGEIRATAFKEMCDKYYEMIQVDKVFFISKCQLKPANKQFTTLKNDYEITFTNDTVVQECMETNDSIPNIKYNFVPIAQLANMEHNAVVDVIGVCREFGDVFQFTAKTSGKELKKREVTLVDSSNAAIILVLWGLDADNFDGYAQPIILLKNTRITEFGGGKTLSMISGTSMKVNPDISEGHKLRGWYDNGGADKVSSSVSAKTGGTGLNTEWMDFLDVKSKNLGSGDKPDYFMCKAVINFVKSNNAFYKSCPTPDCNKKVLDQDNGLFRCEKCNINFPNFKYRLLLNMSIGDWSTNRWITCFSDLAESILQKTSQEVGEALEHDKEQADAILSTITFKSYIFKCRAKVEMFGDSPRNKITGISATSINYKEYNNYLIKNLQELTGIGKN